MLTTQIDNELVFKIKTGYKNNRDLNKNFVLNSKNEIELVERAKHDSQAFGELYEIYFPKVYAFVRARTNQESEAEDLVSDIFVKILENLHKYKHQGVPFAAWLFKVCRNELADFYNKNRKQTVELAEGVEVKDENQEADPKAQAKIGELAGKIKAVIQELKPTEASIVELKFFGGLNNREIAHTLGLSETNVGVSLFRALQKIKPELKHEFE